MVRSQLVVSWFVRPRRAVARATVLALAVAGAAGPSRAGDPTPFSARSGLDVARDAALTWASDAHLVYVENDEDVSADGTAARWGYLFYAPGRAKARGYSVRNGKILEATDLEFDFDAPPLAEEWIDSQAAVNAAEKKAGQEYCREHGGKLSTMLLIRGAFDEKKPDASTWALVYTSNSKPALFVVVDAAKGEVIRMWRG